MRDGVDAARAVNDVREGALPTTLLPISLLDAEAALTALAGVFSSAEMPLGQKSRALTEESARDEKEWPEVKDTYRILVEQIPAVVFLAFIDQGVGEAYVSPQIERALGFTQAEWLQDPARWYHQIHPDDKARWNVEAARMLLTGESLRSVYRALARDGRVVWFHCEVKMVRHTDGRPWFIHGVGFDITDFKQAEEALSHSQEALREYAERMRVLSRRLIAVQEAERRRIALELHDEIGQILTGLKLKLEMSARLPDENVRACLAETQTLVNELMTRTRQLSLDLRPATLDHLGLLPALLRHIRQYHSQTGVRVDFRHSGLEARRFAPELETAAFRIVQEALTNVARHSGAPEAMVRIWADQHTLAVRIEDHGQGFDAASMSAAGRSTGLTGMRERALLLGGQFTVESQPGRGMRLMAEWSFDDHPHLQFHNES